VDVVGARGIVEDRERFCGYVVSQWTDCQTRDCPAVFGELLIVFNCGVLSF
jgi:hypothetical protein